MSGSKYQRALAIGRKALAKNRFAVAAATAVAAIWAPGAFAQLGTTTQIGLDLNTGRGENNALLPTDVAGAPNYRQNNWNMLTGNNGSLNSQTFTTVNPTSGLTSSVTLSVFWGSPNSWALSTTAPTTADGKMMNGYLDSNGNQTLTNDLTLAQNQPYIAVTGLTGEFLNGYKVVLYADGGATAGRTGQYWITTFGGNLANVGGETELTSHVFVSDGSNFNGTYTQVPLTSNTGAGASTGNYVVFDGLQSPNFVLRAEEFFATDTTTRAPINAIQIIASPTLPTDNTEWGLSGGGAWPNAGSWLGPVPDGTSFAANFLGKATGPAAVTLNNNVQVKKMQFNNTNPYTISGSGSININPNSGLGSVTVLSGNHSILVPVTVATTTSFDVATNASLTLASLDAGAQLISKDGGGTMFLNGAVKWGSFSVNNGLVKLGRASILNAGAVTGGPTGTIDLNGFTQSLPRLEGAVNIANTGALTNLFLNPEIGVQHFHTGAITGPINLDISGQGLQGLGGATPSTYTGTTTVGSFTTVRTTGNTAFGATNAGTTLNQGVILQLWNSDLGFENFTLANQVNRVTFTDRGTIRGSISYGGGGTSLIIDANSGVAGSAISLLGDISGNITIGKIGNNGLVLGGHNTFAQLNINQGWLGIAGNSDATAGPVGLVTAPLQLFNVGLRSITGSHTISNPVKIIPSTELTVDPDPAGGTNVGVLTLTGQVNLDDQGNKAIRRIVANADLVLAGKVTGGGITKAGNGTLTLGNAANDFDMALTIEAGKVSINQDSNLGPTKPIFFNGGMIQVTGTTLTNLDSREGNINYGTFSGGFDIANAANTFTVKAPISGSGFFRKDGAGTLLLTGTNTYTGGTTLNGGVLRPVSAGSLPDNRAMTINGGLLDLNGISKTFSSLNGTGGAIGNGANGNISVTIGTDNANASWGGSLQNGPGAGVSSLTKSGTGTQILTGSSTYTGATAVNAGTLQVDGSLANTAVTVAGGATLSGKGTIGGLVTVNSNGTIAPLPTQLGVGGLTLQAGSKLNFLLGDAAGSSLIQVVNPGGLTLNGGAISLAQGAGLLGTSYDLIRYNGALGGNFANLSLATPTLGDTTFTLVNNPGAVSIVVGTSLYTWTGSASGDWDTTTANWKGAGSTFVAGRAARFDDTGTATTVNVTSGVTPARVDIVNDSKDYTFTGSALSAGGLNKSGINKATFTQPVTLTGGGQINGGIVQLDGAATLSASGGVTLGNMSANPRDKTGPLAQARGGTLFLNGDNVNRLGTTPLSLNGGTLVAYKGATAGAGSATVQTATSTGGMSRLIAAPNGGNYTLTVGNLVRPSTSTGTVDFAAASGALGDAAGGQIKLTQVNGAAPALSNGLIGAWATVGNNYASYDPALGVIPNATNIVVGGPNGEIVDGPTTNVRDLSTKNLVAAGNLTLNSLISGGDVSVPTGSTLTVNSGGLMFSGTSKWFKGGGAVTPAAGLRQLVVSSVSGTQVGAADSNGNDHRIQWIIKDNGAPVTVIKSGEGHLVLDAANTYTGGTIVNSGALAALQNAALGDISQPVQVRPGGSFDVLGVNQGIREFIVSGSGATMQDGTPAGAITNFGGGQNNALTKLTLVGDTAVGGTGRWDLRTNGTNLAVLNGGTFTLTKVGTNTVSIVQAGTVNVGNIVVNSGVLSFENANNVMGSTSHTATVNAGGTLQFWNNIAGGISQNKPIVLNGGIVTSENGPTTLTGPIQAAGTGTLRANNLLTITNVISGSGGFNVAGGTNAATNTMLLSANNTYSGPTNINGAVFRVTGSIANSAVTVNNTGVFQVPVTQKVKGLVVNTGGQVQVQPPSAPTARTVLTIGDGTSATSPFSIPASGTSAGRLNLDRNAMIVDVASGGETAALTAVRTAAGNAFHGGLWDQPGLTSTLITATNKLAIGFGLPADALAATAGNQFYGSPVDASSVVARVTINGDATLDSVVNFDDLLALAKNYNTTTAYWAKGDFDYNGVVNFDDLLTLAKNYNQAMPSEPIPGATAAFQADMAAAFAQAAVPEPTGLALLGLAGAAMMGGRRRRSRAN